MSTPRTPDESGQVLIDPSHIKAVNEDLDALDELLPTKEREAPPPKSQIALRADGRMLLSVEDAEGCDFRGRELVTCVVLRDDEEHFARELLDDPLCEVAARLVGRLPRYR